jgi:16S rRNA G1207 methylase RsmC
VCNATEPEKQFALVQRHIQRLREEPMFQMSQIIVMVERNLGFEAEHHQRALHGIPFTKHRIDHASQRYGILTTEEIKMGMMTLFNNMLRDQRINLHQPLFSENPDANLRKLKDQLHIYSFQFKAAANAFGKQRVSLNGKVGGMKDDICIALQLAVYFSNQPHLYA